MGRMKSLAMKISERMGYGGAITPEVTRAVDAHLRRMTMCEGCGERRATEDFLCTPCNESMKTAYDDQPEYALDELDEMEREYYAQREQENGYKHHNGPEE